MSRDDDPSRALGSSDPEERRIAVARLVELPPHARVKPLLAALGDADWRVRKEAIAVAAVVGPDPELLEALVDVFEPGDNVGLRNAAVETLGGFGAAAVEALAGRLSRLDRDGKKLAVEALARTGEPSAFELLAPLLEDLDPNVRVAALEALGAVGAQRIDEVRPLLVARLDATTPLEALAALESLVAVGAQVPFTTIEPWLVDPLLGRAALALAAESGQPEAARAVVLAFARQRDPETMRALCDYVRVSEASRLAAQAAFAAAAPHAEALLLDWLERRDGDVDCTRAALAVVGLLGIEAGAERAVGWLADARSYPEADEALFLLGERAIPALLVGVTREPEIAAACLDLMGRLRSDVLTPTARRALAASLDARSPDVVRAALGALTRVGGPDCLPGLVRLLEDESLLGSVELAFMAISQRNPETALAFVQLGSVEGAPSHAAALVIAALAPRGQLGSLDGARITDFLVRLLMSTSHAHRRAALAALGELGVGDALDAVRFALADEEPSVRQEAIRTLARLRDKEHSAVGVPALLALIEEAREPALLVAALRALGESSDPRGLAVLGPLARSSDARVAVAAIEALSRHADPRRLSSLFDGLHHGDSEVVKAAMLAIAAEPDPRVIVHLGACLDQSAWDVRRLAADLLGRAPSEPSASLLRTRLGIEHDPMVKEALVRALESSGQRRSKPPRRPQGEP